MIDLAALIKRSFDVAIAVSGLVLLGPVLAFVALLIWMHDRKSPFYLPSRVGKDGSTFKMFKFRSMVVNADRIGGSSTAGNDKRITAIGAIVRRYKLDEILQLANVARGEMSLVGPRPQIKEGGTDFYTKEEQKLLTVCPGITDLASIVFADEGEILSEYNDPDLAYNQLIRPWKSRLALLQIAKRSLWLDCRVIVLTLVNIVDRQTALHQIRLILTELGADSQLVHVAGRTAPSPAFPPPGQSEIWQNSFAKAAKQ